MFVSIELMGDHGSFRDPYNVLAGTCHEDNADGAKLLSTTTHLNDELFSLACRCHATT